MRSSSSHFIDNRIYTDQEIDELPAHPQRKGKEHGNWCTCKRCARSYCVVGGEITNLKVINTKKGDKMAFIDVAYDANQYSCTLFPKVYEQYTELLKRQTLFLIAGFKDNRGQIIVTELADVYSVAEEQGWEKGMNAARP